MITRLKVNRFKNLYDVELYFGAFICIAGTNEVGKSNLFDTLKFLGELANKTLLEVALSIRDGVRRSASAFIETHDNRISVSQDQNKGRNTNLQLKTLPRTNFVEAKLSKRKIKTRPEVHQYASELSGRELTNLNVNRLSHLVAENISDFGKLRSLEAFQHFESQLLRLKNSSYIASNFE